MKKVYVITKYVTAESLKDAIELEKNIAPDDAWVEENCKKDMVAKLSAEHKTVGL